VCTAGVFIRVFFPRTSILFLAKEKLGGMQYLYMLPSAVAEL
jgi:hypothetical protein